MFAGGTTDVDGQVQSVVDAENDGFDGIWFGQVFGPDVLTVLALAGQKTSRIEMGTSIIPTYPRHPHVMAQQALTTQAASNGRFNLGIGLSHAPVVEGMWGLSYERPAVRMREYLSVLLPLVREGRVSFSGEFFRVNASVSVPVSKPPPVLIAALAPVMLRMAGAMTDGTITWMVGPKTLETHIVPRINKAADGAGRPKPRIVVGLPVAVTDDADAARERAARSFQVYGTLPNYQRMLNIEGASGPAESGDRWKREGGREPAARRGVGRGDGVPGGRLPGRRRQCGVAQAHAGALEGSRRETVVKVFVAGATGVLGRPTVQALVAAGHSVKGMARGSEKAELLRSMGAEPVSVGLFDSAAVKEAVAGSEAVLHLATKIPSMMRMRSKGAWKENDRLRTEGSAVLVDAALAAGAAVYVPESISFIYSDGGDEWLTEESPVSIPWFSLQSMMNGEKETERFSAGGGRGISLRYGAFYAPYAQSTLDTIRLARRRWLPVPGDGANFVSSIHVDDAASAAVAALGVPAGAYNVVDDEPLRLRDYARAVADAIGAKPPRCVPKWLFKLLGGGPAKYILASQRVSNHKFKAATHSAGSGQAGWSPRYPSAREGYAAIAAELAEVKERAA